MRLTYKNHLNGNRISYLVVHLIEILDLQYSLFYVVNVKDSNKSFKMVSNFFIFLVLLNVIQTVHSARPVIPTPLEPYSPGISQILEDVSVLPPMDKRYGHATVYYPPRDSILVFWGRNDKDEFLSDVWEYVPSTGVWTEITNMFPCKSLGI